MYGEANFNEKSVLQLSPSVRIQKCRSVRRPVRFEGFSAHAKWTQWKNQGSIDIRCLWWIMDQRHPIWGRCAPRQLEKLARAKAFLRNAGLLSSDVQGVGVQTMQREGMRVRVSAWGSGARRPSASCVSSSGCSWEGLRPSSHAWSAGA